MFTFIKFALCVCIFVMDYTRPRLGRQLTNVPSLAAVSAAALIRLNLRLHQILSVSCSNRKRKNFAPPSSEVPPHFTVRCNDSDVGDGNGHEHDDYHPNDGFDIDHHNLDRYDHHCDTITDTSTTTSTSYVHTAATLVARRDLLERDLPVPPWLPFAGSIISSACSPIVTFKTKDVTQATTNTATLTTTTTTTTTASAITTTTLDVVATQCAQPVPADGDGIIESTGQLNFYSDPDANTCCTRCWSGTGCGLWFFFDGFGCFNAVNSDGPNPSAIG